MLHPPRRAILLPLFLLGFCCWVPASLACGTGTLASFLVLSPPRQVDDPQAIASAMDLIETQVQAAAGISPTHTVVRKMITRAELSKNLRAEFEKGYSPDQARFETLAYSVFGLMKGDEDLYQIYLTAYTGGIGGYYDPETKYIYVISDTGFGAEQKHAFAHEYMHALQFQRYDLSALEDTAEVQKLDPERYLGLQAIVEGEASLVEDKWMEAHASLWDRWDDIKQQSFDLYSARDMLRTPNFLWSFIFFPYDQGKTFVSAVFQNGGWAALDSMFRKPPVSSEMILHPDRYYRDDQPIHLPKPALPAPWDPAQWMEQEDSTWGEFGIRVFLDFHLSSEEIDTAATGWGGDRFVVWRGRQDGRLLGLWHSVWDTARDADEFRMALAGWNANRTQAAADKSIVPCWRTAVFSVCQEQSGKDVWWAYAATAEEARTLLSANAEQ
jgi:hypothetical protein